MPFPNDSGTIPTTMQGGTLVADAVDDHALHHRNLGSIANGLVTALGPTTGTNILGLFVNTSGKFAPSVNSSMVFQNVIGGGTFNSGVFGTPAITGGTMNAAVFGTPAITGGTANNQTLGTPTLVLGSDAQGDVFYRSSGGAVSRLAPSTNGLFLQTQGAAANPVWAPPLNFFTTGTQALFSTGSVSAVDVTGVVGTITPTRTVTANVTISGRYFTATAGDIARLILLIDGVQTQQVDVTSGVNNYPHGFCLSGQASLASGSRVIKMQLFNATGARTVDVDQVNLCIMWG